jgi:GNAT superfamily N-acetyltransferase
VIRPCAIHEAADICAVINDAAAAYRGVIPADCWKDPYMPLAELRQEIEEGVRFRGFWDGAQLAGVMALQEVRDVALIRHAYIRGASRRRGIGSVLLTHLRHATSRPLLVGTWAAATWAVAFYERHAFSLVSTAEKECLLQRYWTVPARQRSASVVLADERWFMRARAAD